MATANVEEVLKKIHVVFAKGKTIGGNPDSVVLSKSEMFALLNELNEAMYAVLDKYEASQRSKEKARLEVERRASEIVIQAKQDADDVHAASVLYTDNMLAEVSSAIADATEAMKNEYLLFLQRMDDQIQAIQENRDEINAQLTDLHQGEFYLKALNEFRREEAEDYEEDDETDEEEGSAVSRPVRPSKKKKKEQALDEAKSEPEEEEWPEEAKPAPPVIRVNKPGENSGVEVTTKWNRNKKKKSSPSNADSLFDEEIDDIDAPVPANGQVFTAEDFPNLDAEYEQFKRENGEVEEDTSSEKKGLRGLFSKKGKQK